MLALLAQAAENSTTSNDLRILPHGDELILATIAFGLLVFFLFKKVFPR
jgi:hypothetical protein